ncbi:TBC1 domain family member 7-like isoform X1 [Mya arenaria]|uniref:TBC1 domain family member 7-like isoform X1 n=2 Tax=Mya arenaria TaxID=6604 RepID=UPI0022E4E0D1|nr:TBC1 domain family member 7-like isoform X1 [Mya arenaria]
MIALNGTMSDERNFRSYYYEKVGFRAIEEKKSIELLLKDKPIDVEKLRQYCLRFPVSARYRHYLWKVILGVIPASQDSQEFVMKDRRKQYDYLKHALEIMRRVDDNTPSSTLFLKMFLIEEGLLSFQDTGLVQRHQSYVSLAESISQMVEDPFDAYWITKRFHKMFKNTYQDVVPALPEKVKTLLRKEDVDGKLVSHLTTCDLWDILPIKQWFSSCFASVLPEIPFERVMDKLIGGSVMILVYVAVALLLTLKRPLLTMHSRTDVLKYLTQVPEDSGDILVNTAIDMWEKHGHHLIKSDSPGPNSRLPS